jgi:ATP-dependent Clp protease ATP-binding subunit ClpB
LDSQPSSIDQLERKILQYEVEAHALEKETDEASKQRLAKVKKDLAEFQDEIQVLRAQYQVVPNTLRGY